MRLITCLVFAILLTSCSIGSSGYYTQSVNSWRGGNIKDLTTIWGHPHDIIKTRGGDTILIYKKQSFVSTNAAFPPNISVHPRNGGAPIVAFTPTINTNWNRGFAAYCFTIFTATSAGKIVDTAIQGSNCYMSQSQAKQLNNPH